MWYYNYRKKQESEVLDYERTVIRQNDQNLWI